MIKYELQCADCTHVYEAWFRSSGNFDSLAEAGELNCASCGGPNVKKAIMAPRTTRSGSDKSSSSDSHKAVMVARKAREAMKELRRKVEANCDYVGEKFPEEARRIHYGGTEERGIYGEATNEEHEALRDEGIEVQRIPWIDRTEH